MARLITLSRAARLVGVKRTTLQKRIQAGDLSTFEGQLDLTELMRAYPQTKLEDSAMIERADIMIERALSRVVRDQEGLPDAEVLATRLSVLSHELGSANYRMRRYEDLLQQMQDHLRKLASASAPPAQADITTLRDWLDSGMAKLHTGSDEEGELYATDMLLRVMAAQVHLEPSGHDFFVQGKDNLLESGLRAGLTLDYGCSDGSCGRCVAKLKTGIVKLVRKPRFRLSERDRTQGQTLMCCHTAVTDVVLEVAETAYQAEIQQQQMTARVDSVQRVAEDIAVLSLRPAEGVRLRFLAGQLAQLSSGGQTAEYAIASCPCDEHLLEFHIRKRDGDGFAKQLFAGLGLNQQVEVTGPIGAFTLDTQSLLPVIFVAWDTGFAPIKSLLEHAMALDAAENLYLNWVHTEGELPYLHNRCRAWADALENFHYTHLPADPCLYADTGIGHEQLATVLAAIAEPHFNVAGFDFYLAGPADVLAQSERYLAARGVPSAQVHTLVIAA